MHAFVRSVTQKAENCQVASVLFTLPVARNLGVTLICFLPLERVREQTARDKKDFKGEVKEYLAKLMLAPRLLETGLNYT